MVPLTKLIQGKNTLMHPLQRLKNTIAATSIGVGCIGLLTARDPISALFFQTMTVSGALYLSLQKRPWFNGYNVTKPLIYIFDSIFTPPRRHHTRHDIPHVNIFPRTSPNPQIIISSPAPQPAPIFVRPHPVHHRRPPTEIPAMERRSPVINMHPPIFTPPPMPSIPQPTFTPPNFGTPSRVSSNAPTFVRREPSSPGNPHNINGNHERRRR